MPVPINTFTRPISASDQIVLDAEGNVLGIKAANDRPLRDSLTTAQVAATVALLSGGVGVLSISDPAGRAVGNVLTATPNTGWTVAGYQWTRNTVDIVGQTSSTYTVVSADPGSLIGCRAVTPTFAALVQIPAGAFPTGQAFLDSLPLYLDTLNISLV